MTKKLRKYGNIVLIIIKMKILWWIYSDMKLKKINLLIYSANIST